MIPNTTSFDLTWPVTPNWAGNQILKLVFLEKLGIIRFVLTSETLWCQIRYSWTNRAEVIVENVRLEK